MCDKVVRASEGEARAAAHRARARSGGDLIGVYRCESCDGWHIGHPPLSRGVTALRKKARRKR